MIVYAEYLFINYFTLLFLVQYLSCTLLNAPIYAFRCALAAAAGSILYICGLYTGGFGYLLLLAYPVFCMPLAVRIRHIKDYAIGISVYAALYFAILGAALFIAFLSGLRDINLIYLAGNVPFYISASAGAIIALALYIKKELLKINILNVNLFTAEVINGHCACRTIAYYDTGNMVCTKNGEWVVIVDESLYNRLMPAECEQVEIMTVADKHTLSATPIYLKIYFHDGGNKIYKAMAAKGNISTDRYKIILHKEMR